MVRSGRGGAKDADTAAEAVSQIVLSALGVVSMMSLLLVDPHAHGWEKDVVQLVSVGLPTAVAMLWPVLSIQYWTNLGPLCGVSDEMSLMSPAWGAALAIVYHCVWHRNFPPIFLLSLSAHAAFHAELFTSWCTSLFDWVVAAAIHEEN
ncbi:hypothetical protein V8F06_008607 [Rhypophila decipiens]